MPLNTQMGDNLVKTVRVAYRFEDAEEHLVASLLPAADSSSLSLLLSIKRLIDQPVHQLR